MVTHGGSARAIRIVLVDQYPLLRRGLLAAIQGEADLEVAACTHDHDEALRLVTELKPHVVVAQVSMSARRTVQLLAAFDRHAPVVLLCERASAGYLRWALAAGAAAALSQCDPIQALLDVLRMLADGARPSSPGPGSSARARRRATVLSDREWEVLSSIAQGWSVQRMAQALELSPKTIETYRDNLRRKLCAETNSELTARAVSWNWDRSPASRYETRAD